MVSKKIELEVKLKQRKERKIARDDFQLFMAIEHKHNPYQLQYIMTTTQDEPRREKERKTQQRMERKKIILPMNESCWQPPKKNQDMRTIA